LEGLGSSGHRSSPVRVVLVGFGSVGRALARLIAYKWDFIRSRWGVDVRVVGVVDSKGMALKADGFTVEELLKLVSLPRSSVLSFKPYGLDYVDLDVLYSSVTPDVHVELTPSDYVSGAPALQNVLRALDYGVNVVTANKAPLVLAYDEVMGRAKARGVMVRFKATVMGGSPFIDMLLSMRSHDVVGVEGILNATSNFILTLMEDEMVELEGAIARAQALGVAEANVELDIGGLDAAAKLVIISNVVGKPIRLDDVRRVSLASVKLRDVMLALKEGYTLKYIARADFRERKASVEPVRIPRADILSQVRGTMNAAKIRSDVGDYLFIGRGGGAVETAHTVLDDILSIALEVEGCVRPGC